VVSRLIREGFWAVGGDGSLLAGLGEFEPKITSLGSCEGESTSSSTKMILDEDIINFYLA
jgi:hypothetical protein